MVVEEESMRSTPHVETLFDGALMPTPFSWINKIRYLDLLPRLTALPPFLCCHSDKLLIQAPEERILCPFIGLWDRQAEWKNGYGDPNIGRGNAMGDGHNSHPGIGGGVGGAGGHDHGGHFGHENDGHISYPCHLGCAREGAGTGGHPCSAMGALTDAPFERIRFLLMSAAVYFATLGFTNTIIAHDVRGGSNGTHSIITDLAKGNHMFFHMFTLVNIFGFATSSGALLIRVDKGKLKSGVMFRTCSIIASLCMTLSFSALVVVCVLVSLDALSVTGFDG